MHFFCNSPTFCECRCGAYLHRSIYACWWAKKSTHLAYYLVNEFDLEEEALVPITNLAENVHSSMWVSTGNGCKVKTNLYTTIMDDVVRSIL